MPIWGIEIKSGRPFTLRPGNQNGRLRISQATLGDGPSSKKSLLQCNVGNTAPILLCSLLPDKLESCTLDLEFEEEEDVIFSVLGPRSIHLSGYYVSHCHDHDDGKSDSYGEDINIETDEDEESSYGSSEDEYDDFIVDGDVLEFDDSPPRVSGVKIEEMNDDEQPTDETNRHKLLKERKILNLEASGSEDEDGLPICKGRGKKHSKDAEDAADLDKQPRDKKARKQQEEEEKIEAMGKKRNNDAFDLDGDHNKELDPSETDLKQSRKAKKKKKEVEKAHESGTISLASGPTGEASNNQHETSKEPGSESLKHDRAEKCIPKNTDGNVTEVHEGKKKKKKKKGSADGDKPKEIEQSNLVSSTSKGELDKSRTGEHPKKGTRTFPNGLVIEEISMGIPDGKRASPGSKVSVHYIGKLKKNGEIFDSTVGKRPFKFRLGIGQVIQGWDVGINGMRVGDKRRLIIPPSMGYGSSGVGKIPPNAWLVFDVELVEVH